MNNEELSEKDKEKCVLELHDELIALIDKYQPHIDSYAVCMSFITLGTTVAYNDAPTLKRGKETVIRCVELAYSFLIKTQGKKAQS